MTLNQPLYRIYRGSVALQHYVASLPSLSQCFSIISPQEKDNHGLALDSLGATVVQDRAGGDASNRTGRCFLLAIVNKPHQSNPWIPAFISICSAER
jgi:hypothetical protein